MRLRALALPLAVCLTGCLDVTIPAAAPSADVYAWRADVEVAATGNYFRVDASPAFWSWADAHDVHTLRLVDAAGAPQMCWSMDTSLSINPVALDSRAEPLEVVPFDAQACVTASGALPVCTEYMPCSWPAFCAREMLQRNMWPPGIDPARFKTLDDILAAANAEVAVPDCRPADGRARRICADEDMIAARNAILPSRLRMSARGVLVRLGLAEGAQGSREVPVAAAASGRKAQAVAASNGMLIATRSASPFPEGPLRLTARAQAPTGDTRGGQIFTLHETTLGSELHLIFDREVKALPLQLIRYDDSGKTLEIDAPDPRFARFGAPSKGAEVVTQLYGNASSGTLRFIAPEAAPDLRLIRVTQITHGPKPFISKEHPKYWFKAAGVRPYFALLDTGAPPECDSRSATTPPPEAKPDANWPPPASLGMPYANTSASLAVGASDDENRGYYYWMSAALAIWLVGLIPVLGSALSVRAKRRREAAARRRGSTA